MGMVASHDSCSILARTWHGRYKILQKTEMRVYIGKLIRQLAKILLVHTGDVTFTCAPYDINK